MQNAKPVTDINGLASLVANWFFSKSAQIDHLIEFPEHEPITVMDNISGEERILEGAEREAFIQGLKVARTVFDVLPFNVVAVDENGKPVEQQPEPVEGEAQEV